MKKRVSGTLMLILLSMFFIITCKKTQDAVTDFMINEVVINGNTVKITGKISSLSGTNNTEYGVCYATQSNPTLNDKVKMLGVPKVGSFTAEITGLTLNQTYYFKAFIKEGSSYLYDDVRSAFIAPMAPAVTTAAVTSISASGVSCGGNVTADGGATVIARGVCWSTSANPTVDLTTRTTDGTGTGEFTSAVTGLTQGTTYHVRAYATNSVGTSYGADITFSTGSAIVPPAVTTAAISNIGSSSATGGGNVTSDGGITVTARGVCWSISANPTITDSKSSDGSGTGPFTSSLTNLAPATTYHVRAYATNLAGTSYGEDVQFTTTLGISMPTVTTSEVTSITSSTASGGGNVTSDGGGSVSEKGVCWSTSSNPTTSDSKIQAGAGTGSFTSNLTGLTPGTTYHIRAYAINLAGTSYGEDVSFTTTTLLPAVTTTAVTGIFSTAATSGGNVTKEGETAVTARGVCWSTSQNPTTAGSKTIDGSGPGVFASTITGLAANTLYYVRAYATNTNGTSYGVQVSFTTISADPVVATLTTSAVSAITSNTATGGGNITNDGGAPVTARGICYSTNPDPTKDDSKTINGTGTGTFTSPFTGLSPNTLYYVRAYATNAAGTAYGNQVSFTTLPPDPVLPTLTTAVISGISYNSASSGGNISDDGGSAVTARGICWSTSENPTTADQKTINGTGTGTFTSSLTGLSAGTIYYVRAYATNSVGTAYGDQLSFTTSDPPAGMSTLTTSSIADITSSSATSGGNITSDGGGSITARGVCWSTLSGPTTADSKTIDGNGTGIYSSFLTSLNPGTLYYVRAYATNSAGTAYGNQVSFTTSSEIPSLTTVTVNTITHNSASSGGNITSNGGAAVTARGVCWSTSPGPTTANSKTNDGSGSGGFTSALTSLNASTTYYVRAYATNSEGTAYGNEVSFTTSAVPYVVPTLTTTAASGISTSGASTGGNISNDGGAAVTERGVCYSTSSNPTIADNKTSDGTGPGSFTSTLSGLSASTLYYVRAYATNAAGTGYGNQVSFTTSALIGYAIIITTSISGISTTGATSGGTITANADGNAVTVRGVCWSTTINPTTANSKTTDGSGSGAFTSTITGLTPCTTYHVRAYATNSAGTSYGADMPFTTGTVTPSASTTAISAITSTSASSGGNITGNCASAVTAQGVCWNTSPAPTISNSKTTNGAGGGSFTSSITGLTPCTTYYVRSYATNAAGTVYGNEISFTTSAVLPGLSTTTISGISSTGASSGGNITGDCTAGVTARGVVWSTSTNPTVDLATKTTNGTGGGAYTSTISGLTPCTVYYVRAYATNPAGTVYGNQLSFTTSTVLPTVTTTAISAITSSTASSGGSFTGNCSSAVTARGVCWSTSPAPTTANSKTSNGTGGGTYTSNLTGLNYATTYYVRAYATNAAGTAYGNEISFTTLPVVPSVSTTVISIFDNSMGYGGGNVISTGGAAVTAKGICWNTSGSPTIANSFTNDGSGTGSYSSSITGLSAGTTYYYRAYATNSAGTAYGTQYSITTPARVTDWDGNTYNTVSIYGQIWMQQSLRTTHYDDGTAIILNSDTAYQAVAYYHTYNNVSSNGTTYGFMYNGYSIGLAKDVCPSGWHVPTSTEWSTLASNLGGYSSAGAKMNDMSGLFNIKTGLWTLSYWNNSMTGHNNNSLFYARGGGYYFNTYADLKNSVIFWTNTSKRYVRLDYNSNAISGVGSALYGTDENAFYVRCKKD
jgi:uncharacterized protein (TIGR02145 family)